MNKIVFIIDLDETIIGNCIFQSQLWNISQIYKMNVNKILLPYYSENSKLIRPYFIYFIKKMREIYKDNVYFYIYTASAHEWANTEIKLIEKANNIKFNRPIFTRNDCVKHKKSLHWVKSIDKIKSKIKVKNANYIIIDDSNVYNDNNNLQLFCKPYQYKAFCNIRMYIPLAVIPECYKDIICPFINDDNIKMYKWLYKKCKKIDKINNKCKNDSFWLQLANVIEKNKITEFNEDIIKQLTTIANNF
jgi:hypothetical protein